MLRCQGTDLTTVESASPWVQSEEERSPCKTKIPAAGRRLPAAGRHRIERQRQNTARIVKKGRLKACSSVAPMRGRLVLIALGAMVGDPSHMTRPCPVMIASRRSYKQVRRLGNKRRWGTWLWGSNVWRSVAVDVWKKTLPEPYKLGGEPTAFILRAAPHPGGPPYPPNSGGISPLPGGWGAPPRLRPFFLKLFLTRV